MPDLMANNDDDDDGTADVSPIITLMTMVWWCWWKCKWKIYRKNQEIIQFFIQSFFSLFQDIVFYWHNNMWCVFVFCVCSFYFCTTKNGIFNFFSIIIFLKYDDMIIRWVCIKYLYKYLFIFMVFTHNTRMVVLVSDKMWARTHSNKINCLNKAGLKWITTITKKRETHTHMYIHVLLQCI